MAKQVFGFDSLSDVRRVLKAVRKSENADVAGRDGGRWDNHGQCVVAKIGSAGSPVWKYAWTQQRFNGSGWEDVTDGLTGTTTKNYAIDPSLSTDSDMGEKVVVLVRGPAKDGDDITLCWVVAGSVDGGSGSGCTSSGSPTTLDGSSTSDTAATGSGSNSGGGTVIPVICRVVYNASGDQVLYAFQRGLTFDGCGLFAGYTAETRITVDTPSSGGCD